MWNHKRTSETWQPGLFFDSVMTFQRLSSRCSCFTASFFLQHFHSKHGIPALTFSQGAREGSLLIFLFFQELLVSPHSLPKKSWKLFQDERSRLLTGEFHLSTLPSPSTATMLRGWIFIACLSNSDIVCQLSHINLIEKNKNTLAQSIAG